MKALLRRGFLFGGLTRFDVRVHTEEARGHYDQTRADRLLSGEGAAFSVGIMDRVF
jgi:hypothetical protein